MFDFKYYTPTEVRFGKDSLSFLKELLEKNNVKKLLIHYGSNRVLENGLMDDIKKIIDKMDIEYYLLGGVVANPRLSLVYRGIDLGKKNNIDFILAVGGGSVIDSSKAIAYGLRNDFDVWELYKHERKASDCLPIGVILTNAAAGSEMSNSSVITKEDTNDKRSYNDDIARPRFAIMNPEYTMSLPKYQTMAGLADVMMHTMERYFTNGGNLELTDELAEGLLRTVKRQAYILLEDPNNYDARANLMWASSLAHNNLTGCGNNGGDFVTHMLEHELSGMFDVTHGAGLTAIWPSWARYVYKDNLDRFVKYAKNVMDVKEELSDEDIALEGIKRMEKFYLDISMPRNLKELGINPTDLELHEMAKRCIIACGGKKGSAKVLYEEDMYNILKNALN